MQQYRIQSVSDISRHTFKKLVTLWLTIMFLTIAAGFIVAVGSAKADVLLPLPKAQMVTEPAVLQHFSSSPSPAIIQQRCATHIHPQDKSVGFLNVSSRSQRNAEPQGLQTIMAIKAYRQCVSQIALDQLASR